MELERAVPQTPPGEDLWEAWDELFAALRRARGRVAQQHGNELTLSQLHLLTALAERPQARIGELAEEAGVAPPTATRMLDGLERAGVVKRTPSTSDRRAVDVELTRKGRRLLTEKRELMMSKRRAIERSLTAEERRQAAHLLHRLATVIDEL